MKAILILSELRMVVEKKHWLQQKQLHLLLIIIVLFNSCKDEIGHGDDRLTFANNTTKSIFVVLQYNYPDTTINNEEWTYGAYNALTIDSLITQKFWNSINWEKVIQQNNSQSTITIFLFSSDTIQTYSWQQIQNDYNILKRYTLKIDQLNAVNWIVNYP